MAPPMAYSPTAVNTVIDAVLTEVNARLIALGIPPDRVVRTFGDVAWDECDCGVLTGTATRLFPADTSRQDVDFSNGPCSPYTIGGELHFSMIRCQPGPDDAGRSPSPTEMADAAQIAAIDAYTLWAGTRCVLQEMRDNTSAPTINDFILVQNNALGPLGGCGGWSLDTRVFWTHFCDCG